MIDVKLVVMGVSGCGKTTIGEILATHYQAIFFDGDNLHPRANVEKMSKGLPLTDEERWPWLETVGKKMNSETNVIIACSALKKSYRDYIRLFSPATEFIFLHGSKEVLSSRLGARKGHFFPASLLDTQLALLEPLAVDEVGVKIDIDQTQDEIAEEVIDWIESRVR